jgi:hypothetical protein
VDSGESRHQTGAGDSESQTGDAKKDPRSQSVTRNRDEECAENVESTLACDTEKTNSGGIVGPPLTWGE